MKDIVVAVLSGLHREFDKLLILVVILTGSFVMLKLFEWGQKEPALAMQRLVDGAMGALFVLLTGAGRKQS